MNDGEAALMTHQMCSPLALFYFSIPLFAVCRPRRAKLVKAGGRFRHLLFSYDAQGGGTTSARTADAKSTERIKMNKYMQIVPTSGSSSGSKARSGAELYSCEYSDLPRGRGMRSLEVRGVDGEVLLQDDVKYDDFGRPKTVEVTKVGGEVTVVEGDVEVERE